MDEEQLVNNFAIAYWRHYGEVEKLETLSSIIYESLDNFIVPTKHDKNHLSYAREHWGKEELYNFNNYGWFQFSCVEKSISTQLTLDQALIDMGLIHIQVQKKIPLVYNVNEMMPYKVIEDAKKILKLWDIKLPEDIIVVLSDDPNCHMCQSQHISEK